MVKRIGVPRLLDLAFILVLVGLFLLHGRVSGDTDACYDVDTARTAEALTRFTRSEPGPGRSRCTRSSLPERVRDNSTQDNITSGNSTSAMDGKQQFSIGVILSITGKGSSCSESNGLVAISMIAALDQALSEVLENHPLARGHIAGIEVHNACAQAQGAAKAALALGRQSMKGEMECGLCDPSTAQATPKNAPVIAVVGPALDIELEAASPILSSFELPHVSYSSSSKYFQNNFEYPYLFRTATSGGAESHVILALLQRYSWTYVYMLNEQTSSQFDNLADAVRNNARAYNVCFAQDIGLDAQDTQSVRKPLSGNVQQWYHGIVLQWYHAKRNGNYSSPSVILCLGGISRSFLVLRALLEQAQSSSEFRQWVENEHFVWILGEGWMPVFQYYLSFFTGIGHYTLLGTMTRTPRQVQGAEHFSERVWDRLKKTYSTEDYFIRNPWAALGILPLTPEKKCLMPFESCPDLDVCGEWSRCDPNVSLVDNLALSQELLLQTAVTSGSFRMAMASVVWMLEEAITLNNGSLTKENFDQYRRNVLLPALEKGGWDRRGHDRANDGSFCLFSNNQELLNTVHIEGVFMDGDGGTSIRDMAVWQDPHACNRTKLLTYVDIVPNIQWKTNPGSLWPNGETSAPLSVCSVPCADGSVRREEEQRSSDLLRPKGCCWLCVKCQGTEYHNKSSETCLPCEHGTTPDSTHTRCVLLPDFYYDFESTASIATQLIALVCIIVVVALGTVLYRNRDSTVVKIASLQQSVILIASSCLSLMTIPFLFVYPSALQCGFQSSLVGGFLLLSLAHLVCRTLYHAQHALRDGTPAWLRYISFVLVSTTRRQAITMGTIEGLGVLALVLCSVSAPPEPASRIFIQEQRNEVYCILQPKCVAVPLLAVVLIIFLLLTIAIRKLKHRASYDNPYVPNEATLLGFTAFLLAVFWMSLLPISILTAGILSPIITSVSVLIHNLAVLGCLVIPRVWVLLKKNLDIPAPRPSLDTIRGSIVAASQLAITSPMSMNGHADGRRPVPLLQLGSSPPPEKSDELVTYISPTTPLLSEGFMEQLESNLNTSSTASTAGSTPPSSMPPTRRHSVTPTVPYVMVTSL